MATQTKDAKVPKADPRQLGDASGLYSNGIVNSLDYNRKLTGTAGVNTFDEMRRGDATVRASLLAITLPILAARWWVEPGTDDRQGKKIAEFVENNLLWGMSRSWQETLNEVLLYLVFGRMPFELIWEFDKDGQIKLRKMMSIWPATVEKWKLANGNDGIVQQTINGKFEIPMDKLCVFVNQKEGENWEGNSVLRTAYKHWFIKDKSYLIEAMSQERQGLGVPYAKAPTGGTTEAESDKMEELLANLRANEKGYLLFREGWEVGFLDMKAGTIKNPAAMIQHHDRQISKNVLAQFLELGSTGSGGSWALSQDQSKLFLLSLESVANYVTDNFNKYIIKKLVDFNFNVEEYPELNFEKIGTVDFAKLVVALQQAIGAGLITPDSNIETYLRDVMDLPEFTGETIADPSMADDILGELNGELMALNGTPPAPTGAPDEEMTPEEAAEEVEQTASDYKKLTTAKFTAKYGSEVLDILTAAGTKGVGTRSPLSEETKRKISEALSKGKGKGKGAKGTNPAVKAKQAEITAITKKVKDFNDSVRRDLLEMKAKGIKLSPEEMAKKQLDIFDKKKVLSDQVAKLKGELATIKESTKPATAAKPPAKAHEHDAEATSPVLLKMSEDISGLVHEIHNELTK
jgi:phage gp29-like protein